MLGEKEKHFCEAHSLTDVSPLISQSFSHLVSCILWNEITFLPPMIPPCVSQLDYSPLKSCETHESLVSKNSAPLLCLDSLFSQFQKYSRATAIICLCLKTDLAASTCSTCSKLQKKCHVIDMQQFLTFSSLNAAA